jgi:meso-butanediol dehydrogenase/(S,S)-butanediol dehydrogenase/diacetyl reductase
MNDEQPAANSPSALHRSSLIAHRLRGKVAIVTGAAGGIGGATARRFAAEGARVAALDRSAEGLAATAQAIEAAGGEALPIALDVTDGAAVQGAVAQVLARWGRLDVLFNGAGASGRKYGDGPADECSEEGWAWTLNVNLTSAFLLCKHALPPMLAAGAGSIVNLASVLGMVGGDEDFATHAYAASKGGQIGLARAMAATYAREGIRCNVVCPGLIETPMSRRVQDDERLRARLPELQPLTGTFGRPEDVAQAVVYLATAPFVTGAVLPVDGGWTAR